MQYYKDINPATLTGAIDVIVVERPTESGQVELACSPFHVRFGKLSVLRPVDKKVRAVPSPSGRTCETESPKTRRQVRIAVNDERIPFYMKVGETGEAFFVFETDSDVPADMQTSPLSGPLSDDGRSDAGVSRARSQSLAIGAWIADSASTTDTGGRAARPGRSSHERWRGGRGLAKRHGRRRGWRVTLSQSAKAASGLTLPTATQSLRFQQ